jgi:N utilization substance protein B
MSEPKNMSLKKKRAARMGAVQALYSHSITGSKPKIEKMVEQIAAHWQDSLNNEEPDWALEAAPDTKLLERILTAAFEHAELIEEQIDSLILPGWRKERISAVSLSTLRAFAGEMIARPDTNTVVLIDEYTDVAASFTAEQEISFIHSAMNHLARALRMA